MDYVGQTFNGGVVRLDDSTFDRCIFRDCTLQHEGGSFQIRNGLRVEGSLTFDLRGGEATLALLQMLGRQIGYVDILGTRFRLEGEVGSNEGTTSGYNDQRGAVLA